MQNENCQKVYLERDSRVEVNLDKIDRALEQGKWEKKIAGIFELDHEFNESLLQVRL